MTEPIRNFRGRYSFLSNFYTCDINSWPSVEHAFQAAKTNNARSRERIWRARTPREAKRLGSEVLLRRDWEDIKVDQMRALLLVKFAHPGLRAKLLATGDAELVEENYWHDNFWGRCICSRCEPAPKLNWLGRLLMEIRGGIDDRYQPLA